MPSSDKRRNWDMSEKVGAGGGGARIDVFSRTGEGRTAFRSQKGKYGRNPEGSLESFFDHSQGNKMRLAAKVGVHHFPRNAYGTKAFHLRRWTKEEALIRP